MSDVDPVHEVGNVLKRTARFAFGNQRLHVGFADALDRRQRVTDLAVFHRKVVTGFINVRRQHRYPHLAAFVLEKLQLVGVGNVKAHGRAHKFDRVMRLEVSRLVRNQRIGRGVGLVETVGSKLFHLVENAGRGIAFDPPVDEDAAVFDHFFFDFLTHRLTQLVRAAQGIAGQFLGNLHNLFLIDHDAVGAF